MTKSIIFVYVLILSKREANIVVKSWLNHQQTLAIVSPPLAIKMRKTVAPAFMELYGLTLESANYGQIQPAIRFCVACNLYL